MAILRPIVTANRRNLQKNNINENYKTVLLPDSYLVSRKL